jgi:hypothetical protein
MSQKPKKPKLGNDGRDLAAKTVAIAYARQFLGLRNGTQPSSFEVTSTGLLHTRFVFEFNGIRPIHVCIPGWSLLKDRFWTKGAVFPVGEPRASFGFWVNGMGEAKSDEMTFLPRVHQGE